MITFTLSFVLAFSLKHKSEDKKKGKGKKGKANVQEKIIKQKKKNKKEGKVPIEAVPEVPKYVFEFDEILGVAHIEYELIPNKGKYYIDVKCWGPIAKIYTNDGQITLKTVIRDEMAWVPICLKHYLESISIFEIKTFRNYIVVFDMENDASKLGKIATSDNINKFYTYESETDVNYFVEVFNEDPNLEDTSVEKVMDNPKKSIDFSKTDFESRLNYSDFETIYRIINNHCDGIEMDLKDFVLPCAVAEAPVPKKVLFNTGQKTKKPNKEKSSKGSPGSVKNDKKKKKGKKTDAKLKLEKNSISIPGEVFFTDPNWALYGNETDYGAIRNTYILVSADRLLSRSQKLLLDPLVVKVKKLSKIPVALLKENGITAIYTSYEIPSIADCKSIEKPVAKRIKFNEAHIFFNENISKLKLIEFIQSRKLFIEIYGIKTAPAIKTTARIFGCESADKDISKIKPYKIPENCAGATDASAPVLLAVASYDISSVVQNIWDFQEKAQCHVPGLTLHQKCLGHYEYPHYFDTRNVNEINLILNQCETKSPILEDTLLKFGTTLKVEVYLMSPQTASLILLKIPNSFKRFLFIIYDLELAANLITDILKNNNNILSDKKTFSNEHFEYTDIITGFTIDDGNSVTMFVEGLSAGFILNLENITVINYEPRKGKFFFNTDAVFERRIYKSLIKDGLHIITLRIPFHKIFSDQRIYLKGNMPPTCLEALKKLCLLYYSASYKSIIQYNLLPKPEELLSFNVEWGVPITVKKEEEKLRRTTLLIR